MEHVDRDLEEEKRWFRLLTQLGTIIGKRPADLNAVLFLIGVRELGAGLGKYTKEQKQDLMHIAICKVLSYSDFYELEGKDEDGWPHWKSIKKLPHFDLLEQEKLLKEHVYEYFERELDLFV